MNRREFVAVTAAALGVPTAFAQRAGSWRVGILTGISLPSPPEKHPDYDAFIDAMKGLGYVAGRNVEYVWRTADGDYERLPKLAAELAGIGVDLMIVQSTPGVRAAREATKTVPIVFVGIGDPVASGLIASLAKPGGNVTGIANLSVALDGKRVELLAEMVGGLSKIGVMLNPANPTYPLHVKEFGAAAQRRGLRLAVIPAQTPEQIEKGFETLRREHASALIVQIDNFFLQRRAQIGISAAAARVPTMFGSSDYVEAGGLASYGHRLIDQFRKAAGYADRIFKGAVPAELPVELPTKVELVVSVRTAKALGITIPQKILLRADRVIE